jgi:gamma-glutamylcyclotransferase (GGCT)/AIG2-like uncharacterized protein YtfP
MSNIFTYGSLMFPEVWERVVGSNYHSSAARLDGYVRRQCLGETYPVIVRQGSSSHVQGMLYIGISTEDLARLDRFEGEYYIRRSVEVITSREASSLEAFTYVLSGRYRHLLSESEWDPGYFLEHGLHRFLTTCAGFDR